LARRPEGKRVPEKTKRRWADNIGMDLRDTGWEDVDWMHLAEDRVQWKALVNTVINIRISYMAGNFLTG
jgi:hypothetical protein